MAGRSLSFESRVKKRHWKSKEEIGGKSTAGGAGVVDYTGL